MRIAPLLSLLCCIPAYALDLGVAGTTWPILEPDVRRSIAESASQTDWEATQKTMTDSSKNYLSSLPKHSYPPVKNPTLQWLDLSIELDRDISVPLKNTDGSYSWTQLAPKGTRINPLSSKTFTQALLFFDGNNPQQLQLAKDLLAREPLLIMPIEAGQGQVDSTAKALNKPVFYASDYMRQQFNLKALPTLAFQGPAPKNHLMATIAFPLNTSADQVLYQWTTWPSWTQTFSAPKTKETPQ